MMVALYNCLGESLEMDLLVWVQTLDRARQHGWHPLGTEQPPVNLGLEQGAPDREWSPMSYLPHGQRVLGRDAVGMAEALGHAEERCAVVDFLGSCGDGGFLICPYGDIEGRQAESAAISLANLGATLGQSVSVRETLETLETEDARTPGSR